MTTAPIQPEEQRALDRVTATLRTYRTDVKPAVGWQTRVLAKVRAAPPPRHRWWLLALPGPVLACAIALAVWWPSQAPLHLAIEVAPTGQITRGRDALVGDRVRATAAHGNSHRALWVYRDGQELVVACPGDPRCQNTSSGISIEFTLSQVGEYRVDALSSSRPIAAPLGLRDDALAAAKRAGAVQESSSFVVR
jgi:hypothetical protein